MVLSWLIRSITPSIMQTDVSFKTMLSLWENLKERFAQSDVYRIAELQGEIFNISQGNHIATDFFTALPVLWDE